MISLRQAKLTDAIPATLAAQPWAQALAYAEWRMRGLLLEYAQDSQIYTALDTCPEMVLDALAVSWKVDWYDTTYPVEIKRSIIRSCMAVRRYMGTAWSAKKALSDVWPDSGIEEWFDYGGEPGRFRVVCNVTDPTVTAQVEVIENNVMLYKRESAHLDSISFMVRHGIQIGAVYEAYKYDAPRCGMIRCGTWPRRATLGRTEGAGLVLTSVADAFAAEIPLCGTLPYRATLGRTENAALAVEPAADAYLATNPEAGAGDRSGTVPRIATIGYAGQSGAQIAPEVGAYNVTPVRSGQRRCGHTVVKKS